MKNTTKQSKPFSAFDWIKAIIDTKQSWNTFTPEQQKVLEEDLAEDAKEMAEYND